MKPLSVSEHDHSMHGALSEDFSGWVGRRGEYAELATAADRLLLLREGDEVVGIAGLSISADGRLYVEALAAKRSGYGRPLVDALTSRFDYFYLYSAFPEVDVFYDGCGLSRLWPGSSYFEYCKYKRGG